MDLFEAGILPRDAGNTNVPDTRYADDCCDRVGVKVLVPPVHVAVVDDLYDIGCCDDGGAKD